MNLSMSLCEYLILCKIPHVFTDSMFNSVKYIFLGTLIVFSAIIIHYLRDIIIWQKSQPIKCQFTETSKTHRCKSQSSKKDP